MFDADFVKTALLYVPISVIGLWRWTYWAIRRFAAALYKPDIRPWPQDKPRPTVSLVTPVYNEDPEVFERAMQSWIKNGVDEIIAVIDKSNVRHIVDYEERYVHNRAIKTKCRMIVTPKPGKRAALCDGIDQAKGDIIALVDSDTIWDDHVLEKSLVHFANDRIGGTTVAQRISNPDSIGNIMFDILLWTRYRDEVPFLLAVGKVFNTLSGRTAFYRREALLSKEHDNVHNLRHEFFFGTRGISGDDKRLTHLILEQGWHVAYVGDATVYTPGLGSIKSFLKQRLRWTRNSWRADLRAVAKGWVWNHPALALFMIDRFIQPFFMLIGPIVLVVSVVTQDWMFVAILLAWWTISRFIKLFGYFKAYPGRLIYLPAYILYGYTNAVIKIYALATIVEHSWATRWHIDRVKTKKLFRRYSTVATGVLGTIVFLFVIGQFVSYTRAQSAADVIIPPAVDAKSFDGQIDFASTAPGEPRVPTGSVMASGVMTYTVQPGDSPATIAASLGVDEKTLRHLNGIINPKSLQAGQVLLYLPEGNQQP